MADVVQLDVAVVGAGEQLGAVRAEAEGADGHGVTLQRVHQLAARQVEHVDDAVYRPGGEVLPVTRGRQTQGELALAVQTVLQLALEHGYSLPNHHRRVCTCVYVEHVDVAGV